MFQMVAEDIFHIEGHGTVLTGHIEFEQVALGDAVEVRATIPQLIGRRTGGLELTSNG